MDYLTSPGKGDKERFRTKNATAHRRLHLFLRSTPKKKTAAVASRQRHRQPTPRMPFCQSAPDNVAACTAAASSVRGLAGVTDALGIPRLASPIPFGQPPPIVFNTPADDPPGRGGVDPTKGPPKISRTPREKIFQARPSVGPD